MRPFIIGLMLALMPVTAAAQRLRLIAAPEHYDLHFIPDLQAERFEGRARIRVQVLRPTDRFVLNAADLTLSEAAVTAGGRRQVAAVALDEKAETLTLTVPEPVSPGPAELDIDYDGILNRELRGFYISEAAGRKYAVTQLEATDARRMFPSFDEPGFKATFALSVAIDEGDTAISNGAVVSTTPGPVPGKKTVVFDTTERMSTYLVALAIGDFECVAAAAAVPVPLRVCATPGNRELTSFALDAGGALLAWLNDYFSTDYPFGKVDLVAIPDFAAGAMENTGAIFFRESLLLVADDASLAARKRAAIVIAHELAHQWFGNLVTMQWWDDLWLNEGFASWMETRAVAAWKPEWQLEIDELQATHSVMEIDALRSTRPVRARAETPAEINALFDPIAYEKGAAVLGMLESYVGADAFRGGINAYLHEYRYANATTEQFWTMMARATGTPADAILRSFVEQPGVPLVTVDAVCRQSDTHVTLTQERFLASPAAAGEPEPLWSIPVCLETEGGDDSCHLLDERMLTVTLPGCGRWVMGNKDAEGYYRTQYSEESLERLRAANAALDPGERLALLADQWALLAAGRAGAGAFLDAADALASDVRTPGVLDTLVEHLQFLHEYVVSGDTRPAYEAWIRNRFGPALAELAGSEPSDDADQRRLALLLTFVGRTGRDGEVVAQARRRVEQYLAGETAPPATVLGALVPLAAASDGAALYEQYVARAEEATVPEERYRFLHALATFRDPALLRRTVEYALSPRVRAQDRVGLLASLLGNPAGRELTWSAIQSNWEALQEGLGAFGGSVQIVNALSAFCDSARAGEIRAFFEAHPVAGAERALRQTLEDIERCARLRSSQATALDAWLAAATAGARP